MLQRIRSHASYANVMATLAVFVAIGGTSYAAITLPRNSVGERQIKSRAVGAKELKRGAVGSRAIKNGAIEPQDLSSAHKVRARRQARTRRDRRAQPAVTLRASFNVSRRARRRQRDRRRSCAPEQELIDFSRRSRGLRPDRDARTQPGGATTDPGPGRIVVAIEGNRVAVETFKPDGTPDFLPFNVIVAC